MYCTTQRNSLNNSKNILLLFVAAFRHLQRLLQGNDVWYMWLHPLWLSFEHKRYINQGIPVTIMLTHKCNNGEFCSAMRYELHTSLGHGLSSMFSIMTVSILFCSHSNTVMSWHSMYLSSPEQKLKLSSCNIQRSFTTNMKHMWLISEPITSSL